MKKKVSVLVPVYGVERYLEVFLNSLSRQTLDDIEFIIVNDASPDGSHEIIERFVEKDSRFLYINKKVNEGLYKARQDAFSSASGEFIINLDSDDYISPNFLKSMYEFGRQKELDIVVSNVSLVDEEGKRLSNSKSINHMTNITFSAANMLSLLTIPYATWCRMYKRELLVESGYTYEKGELYLTNYHFLEGVRSGLAAEATYFYRIRDNSMSSISNSSKKLQNKFSKDSIHDFNSEITTLGIDAQLLPSFNIFNNLSFTKLNFISCIYGNETQRYKSLKSTINSEFPVRFKNIVKNLSIIPKELAVFSVLDTFGFTPLMLYIKSRKIK